MSSSKAHYIYILGATCTGKSSLAIAASKAIDGAPIMNCDSVQVFDGIDVGTAKPSQEELAQAPHHLFGHVPCGREYSVANYLNDVLRLLKQESFPVGLFCGGSGFYVQALQKGLYPQVETTKAVQEKVWQAIEDKGFPAMYQWLLEKDPEYGQKIHEKDHYRIRRGLEVLMSQDLSISELKKKMALESKSPLPNHTSTSVGLFWERSEQKERVHERTLKMLEKNWIQEVQTLLDDGLEDWAPLRSVGYKEIRMHLDGELSLQDLPDKITTATMQLIKKQTTWFKKEKDIQWFHAEKWQEALAFIEEQRAAASL